MSNEQTRTRQVPNESTAPTHALFHIEERGNDKAFWREVAVGWKNADGSVNLRTNVGAILLPGQVYQLRIRTPRNVERSE